MYVNSYIGPLINEFGLLEVASIWIFLGGVMLLFVSIFVGEGKYLVSILMLVFAIVGPGVSIWILKLIYTNNPLPFPPRRIFGVDVVDISGLGMLVMVLVAFLFAATEELTGSISK